MVATTIAEPTKTYKRVAYHATFRDQHGQAIRDQRGRVWFMNETTDRVQQLTDADMPALHLHGRVDLSADQRRLDLERGNDLAQIEARTQEAAILAA